MSTFNQGAKKSKWGVKAINSDRFFVFFYKSSNNTSLFSYALKLRKSILRYIPPSFFYLFASAKTY